MIKNCTTLKVVGKRLSRGIHWSDLLPNAIAYSKSYYRRKKNSLKYPCLYRPDVKNITPQESGEKLASSMTLPPKVISKLFHHTVHWKWHEIWNVCVSKTLDSLFSFCFFLCDGKTTHLEITPLFPQFNSAYDLVTKRENFPSRCCAF